MLQGFTFIVVLLEKNGWGFAQLLRFAIWENAPCFQALLMVAEGKDG